MKKLSCFFMFVLLTCGLLSCSSEKKKAKKADLALKGTSTDVLQPLMTKTQANLRILTYGVMNFDKAKVDKSVVNLIELTDFTGKNTKHKQKAGLDWVGLCEEQKSLLVKIQEQVTAKNHTEAAEAFGKLIGVCVECHKPYRKASL